MTNSVDKEYLEGPKYFTQWPVVRKITIFVTGGIYSAAQTNNYLNNMFWDAPIGPLNLKYTIVDSVLYNSEICDSSRISFLYFYQQ